MTKFWKNINKPAVKQQQWLDRQHFHFETYPFGGAFAESRRWRILAAIENGYYWRLRNFK